MRTVGFYFISFLFLYAGFEYPSHAQKYMAEDGKALFTSETPLTTFTGESAVLAGLLDLNINLVDFYLDLNTLDTGIGLRDKHMRKNYLETDKYPFAEFTGKLQAIPSSFDKPIEVTVEGTFKIHGVEREVLIPGSMVKEAGGIRVRAAWELLLQDYQIEIPKVVFYQLSEKQLISIDILLKPNDE